MGMEKKCATCLHKDAAADAPPCYLCDRRQRKDEWTPKGAPKPKEWRTWWTKGLPFSQVGDVTQRFIKHDGNDFSKALAEYVAETLNQMQHPGSEFDQMKLAELHTQLSLLNKEASHD